MLRLQLGRLAAVGWLVCRLSAASAAAAAGAPASDSQWFEGYALVELEAGADLQAARQLVQARGGTVALLLPPNHIAGWIPPDLDGALLGRAGIRAVHREGADVHSGADDPAGRAVVRFFERATRGELDPASASSTPGVRSDDSAPDLSEPHGTLRPDAWPRDPISEFEIAANLSRLGIAPPPKRSHSLFGSGSSSALASNSDYMTGTVSVTLFFVESDGSASDPDLYDWTSSAEEDAFADAAAALSWWALQAKKHSDCWVVFRLEAHFATEDPRCAQWREPLLHPSTDYAYAVQQVLGNFGYVIGGHLSRAAAFDAAMRVQNRTDWAYSAFIAANPSGPREFTDGYSAWAYIGGPYLAMLQRNFGWTFKQVFAHETGHMFRACDEYYTPEYGGCTSCDGCADTGVPNGNCEECNPAAVSCMMRSNSWAVCDWTAGQIGWWRTPCTDWDYPAPRIDAAQPTDLVQGLEADIEVRGDFFSTGSTVSFGSDIQILSQTVVSDSLLRARIRVSLESAPGNRSVVVTGPDGQEDRLVDGLVVRVTPRHYVSRVGGHAFPFDRPEMAAADLASVLAACSTGDTILLAGGTYGAITLGRGIVILGGWTDDFGIRLPEAFPSIVDAGAAGPALRIDVPGASPVLDGLVLRGGRASLLSTPELGPMPMGGALLVIDAAPTLRGCRLEASQAGDASTPGAGGGAFFWRASARLEGCTIQSNQAARGAGLFLLRSDVVLDDVVVEGNDGGGAGLGAGIAGFASRIEVRGGRVTGNRAAQDGGGLHLEGCTWVRLERVVIDDNAASRYGGGIATHGSRLEVVSARLTRNQAGERGGGLHAEADSLSLESTVIGGNTAATLGGGLHVAGCRTTLVNVTVAANDGGPASGVFWGDAPSAGTVRSCIVAGNVLGGFVVSGGIAPLADYNLFAANGGADRVGLALGPHGLDAGPRFSGPETLDFGLGLESPGIDSGDPDASRADPDGSQNDRGAHGGPHAWPPAPARVTGLQATLTNSVVRLSWEATRESNIASYVVYRDTVPELQPAESKRVAVLAAPATSWFDDDPRPAGRYVVVLVDGAGRASGASIAVQPGPPSDVAHVPGALALHPIAPNPANPGAWVDYELPLPVDLHLAVFTARGTLVRVLHVGPAAGGRRRHYWDGLDDNGRPVASGVYWVRLVAGTDRRSRKLVVVR